MAAVFELGKLRKMENEFFKSLDVSKSLDDFVATIIKDAESEGLTHIGVCNQWYSLDVGDYIPDDEELNGTYVFKINPASPTGLREDIKELILRLLPGESIMLVGGTDSYVVGHPTEVVIKRARVLHIFSEELIRKIINLKIIVTSEATITTEEIGAVNRVSSKIRAISEQGSLTVNCDRQLSIAANHARAARFLVEKKFVHIDDLLWVGGETKRGYCFVNISKDVLRKLMGELLSD